MTRLRLLLTMVLLIAAIGGAAGLGAQAPDAPPPPPDSTRQVPPPDADRQAPTDADRQAPPPDVERPDPLPPEDPFGGFGRSSRAAFRIGGDYRLNAADRVREVVVIFGNADIDGTVDQHVVVILGTARLGPNARVGDDFVIVGGGARVEDGAVVDRDLVVVGGGLDAPAGFTAGGEHVVIGPPFLGAWFEGLTAWLTRGLLFGRLIVPDLEWIWGAVAVFFLIYLALNVLFEGSVRTIATTLTDKPLTAFGVGLLVLLLFGPVATLLAVSVIGIAVIPFLVCAVFAAWIIGKVAVARWIGNGVMPEDEPHQRAQAVRSFVIGFALVTVAYMIPVLGIVTWAIIGVLGLGAASMAFIAAYRRERPAVAAAPGAPPAWPATDRPLDVPPPPVPAPYQPPPVSGDQTPLARASVSEASSVAAGAAPPPTPPPAPSYVPPPPPAMAIPGGPASTLLAMPRALFRDRFAAFVLDVIIIVIGLQILDVIIYNEDDVFPLLVLLYHVGFWTWKQTTPGGIICQLRLVRVDGNPITFADALVRALVGIFSLAVFFIGALWMLRDQERQTWHDKVAGTYVVKVPRNWPL